MILRAVTKSFLRPSSSLSLVFTTTTPGFLHEFVQFVHNDSARRLQRRSSTNLHVESDGSFITLASLKLDSVAFVEIFDLCSRREAAAMKEDLVTAIVRDNKT